MKKWFKVACHLIWTTLEAVEVDVGKKIWGKRSFGDCRQALHAILLAWDSGRGVSLAVRLLGSVGLDLVWRLNAFSEMYCIA